MKHKKKLLPRNIELAVILKNDPARLRARVVESEKGKVKKSRAKRKKKQQKEMREY